MSGSGKRSRNLLILGGILVLLGGSYAYLKFQPAETPKQKAEPAKPVIQIAKLNAEDLTRITVRSERGTLSLVKVDESWGIEAPHPVKADETALYGLLSSFTNLTAAEIVDPAPQDLSQYGLAKPAVVAVAELNDRTTRTYYLGDRIPTGAGFYFKAGDDPRVFLISYADGRRFSYSLAELRDLSLPAINPQELTYFKLSRPGRAAIEIVPNDQPSGAAAQYQLSSWKMVQPYREPKQVNSDRFKPILDTLADLNSFNEAVDDNPSDLGKYGLQPARAELTVKDRANRLRLLIGKERDETSVYCKTDAARTVFAINKDRLASLENAKPLELMDKFVYIVNIDDVDRITVAAAGRTHTITIGRRPKPGSSAKADVATVFRIDGKTVPDKAFRKYYQSLIGLMVEAENDRARVSGASDLQTVFYLNKGEKREVRIDYVPYNQDFDAVVSGGKAEFLISREQVRGMLKQLEDLIQGKLPAEN
jgi:hypothetical protein